jgi:hypothetical protein
MTHIVAKSKEDAIEQYENGDFESEEVILEEALEYESIEEEED